MESKIWFEQGGAAFPISHSSEAGAPEAEHGMSLRDWLAGQALPAVISATCAGQHNPVRRAGENTVERAIARDAYSMADAMLVARAALKGSAP